MGKNIQSSFFIWLLLGILAGFGPLVTDMYLPVLPSLTGVFKTTPSMVQLGLTSSMIGLAGGQLIIGPLSDKLGRKLPLLISLILFIISTVACIYSSHIETFIFWRLIQGIAGSGGIVISRSITTDLFKGNELAKAFALISAINGLAPISAPILGGFVLKFYNWQGIFWTLLILGICLLFMSARFTESLPLEKRSTRPLKQTFHLFIPVLKNSSFMKYVWVQTGAMTCMFSYIASSSFVLQDHFHVSPQTYSLIFGGNAVGSIIGATLSTKFKHPSRSLFLGSLGMITFSFLVGISLINGAPLLIFEIFLFFLLSCCTLVLPPSTALAMGKAKENAGTASAILGAMAFIAGGIVSPLVSLGNLLYASSLCLFIGACLTFLTVLWTRKKPKTH